MHKEWEFEAARIKEVRELISKELVDRLKKSDELKADTRKLNKEMWDETGGISSLELGNATWYLPGHSFGTGLTGLYHGSCLCTLHKGGAIAWIM